VSKGRLIESKFIRMQQDEIARLTRQVANLQMRILALKAEIALRERNHDSSADEPKSATLDD
jgi:hypothetical protein